MFTIFKSNGCTNFNEVYTKWLLTALARAQMKSVMVALSAPDLMLHFMIEILGRNMFISYEKQAQDLNNNFVKRDSLSKRLPAIFLEPGAFISEDQRQLGQR